MSTPPAGPVELGLKYFKLTDVDITLADPQATPQFNLKQHVSAVTFTPTASTSTFKTLSPNGVFSSVDTATWTCVIAYAQDWETEGSLALLLFENEGEQLQVRFTPRSGRGPSFEALVTLTPGTIGGTVASDAVGSVTLGVAGRPTLVPAA